MATNEEYFELTGIGYNIMTRKANKYGKFQIDLELVDPDQIAKAEEMETKFGMKIKDSLKFTKGGALQTKTGISAVTLVAKEVTEGKFPRKFVPTTKADTGEIVNDLISHGAKVTVRVKRYPFKGGSNAQGYSWNDGYAFQLENVKVHEYIPYKTA